VGCESLPRQIHALLKHAIQERQGLVLFNVGKVLLAFYYWFTHSDAGLPCDPRQANSRQVSLCTYERRFVVDELDNQYTDSR